MTDQEKQELSDDRAAMLAAKAKLQADLETAKFAYRVAHAEFEAADQAMSVAENECEMLEWDLEDFEENW